jgi:hypothetical protein
VAGAPVLDGARPPLPGAYGLALAGEALGPEAVRWLGAAPAEWPVWTVERRPLLGAARPSVNELSDEAAQIATANGGTCAIAFEQRAITLHLGELEPAAAVLHPGLAPAFILAAHQRGLPCFHAGVVVLHGVAWGVLGHKGAGKSTLLAELDRAGHPVLADDLLVIDGGAALRGPRFIDLRGSAAARFPQAVDAGRLGLRHRHRLPLGAAPDQAPFGGWLVPAWAEALAAEPVPIQARIGLLTELLSVRAAPKSPAALLDLAARPMLRISRPKDFARCADALDLVIEATGAASAAAQ